MKCKNCNTQFKGKVCPSCNTPAPKTKLYKKWWFWVVVSFCFILLIGIIQDIQDGPSESPSQTTSALADPSNNAAERSTEAASSKYKAVTIESLFSELEANAMRAQNNYEGKYVELNATIDHINGDGGFIRIRGYGNDYDTIKCWVKKEHLDFLMEKNEGERVKIKGKITHVSSSFGYTIDVDSISNVNN